MLRIKWHTYQLLHVLRFSIPSVIFSDGGDRITKDIRNRTGLD